MKFNKTQLAAAVGTALLTLGSTAVQAQPAFTVTLGGQVSRAVMYVSDEVQSKWFHVDNEASGTRFRLTGASQWNPDIRAGFLLEWDFQSNESQLVTFATQSFPGAAAPTFPQGGTSPMLLERHMDAFFEHRGFGMIRIGQGDGAANGASESDLSGTGMANGIGVADLAGGFGHRGAGGVIGPTIGATINQQDFESRYDRLMYATPVLAGFRGMVTHGAKDNLDVIEAAVFYNNEFKGFGRLAAALGYSRQDRASGAATAQDDVVVGGSVSFLHASGLNATYSYTNRENPGASATGAQRDSTFNYFKVGWKAGQHAIAVDYAMGDDFAVVGDEAKMYGIGYVFSPTPWLELIAAYKVHQLDRTVGSFEDISVMTLGTRVRF